MNRLKIQWPRKLVDRKHWDKEIGEIRKDLETEIGEIRKDLETEIGEIRKDENRIKRQPIKKRSRN